MKATTAIFPRALLIVFLALAFPIASFAHWDVGVTVAFAPPELPVYSQPPCPAPGYIWTPGYWSVTAAHMSYTAPHVSHAAPPVSHTAPQHAAQPMPRNQSYAAPPHPPVAQMPRSDTGSHGPAPGRASVSPMQDRRRS